MKPIEKIFSIVIGSVLYCLVFYQFAYVRSGNDVQSAANAITFLPYALGPCLICSYKNRVSRFSFYSVLLFYVISPVSTLVFILALIIAIWPTTTDESAVADASEGDRNKSNSPATKESGPKLKGESEYAIIVTKDLVLKVKNKLIEGLDVEKVAGLYKISKSTVYKIRRNQYDHLFEA